MKKYLVIIFGIIVLLLIGFKIYENSIFKENIPVLAYHDVTNNPLNETDISISNFEQQMKYLYKNNYKTLSLDEYWEWKNGKNIKGKKVVLTFDDGDESFYTKVIPILEKYNFKAVVFVIKNAVGQPGYLTEEQIKDIKDNKPNFKVESHSYNLHNDIFANSNDYEVYNDDMKKNQDFSYQYYAYPFGITNQNYKKALGDNNYKLAFLFSPSKWSSKNQENYAITRVPVYKSNSLFKFIMKVSLKI